jgi:hypothetical protein
VVVEWMRRVVGGGGLWSLDAYLLSHTLLCLCISVPRGKVADGHLSSFSVQTRAGNHLYRGVVVHL